MKRIRALCVASGSPAVWELVALVVILLVATFFRVHLFEVAPPGLQHDEAFKANFALDVLDGGWPVYFDPNGGEEAIFPYLAALSILLFGPNFVALRLVSLVCGILSVILSYCVARELFGRRVALFTTAMLAVSFWHIFDSRVALRPITLLMMALASFYLFWLGLRRGGILPFALCGVALGLSFYTYTSGFLVPLTVVFFVLCYLLPFHRALLLERWRGILLALILALFIFLPMAYHVYTHPVASTARARDLSDHVNLLLEGQPGPIVRDVLNVAGMFGVSGDPEWRYNLAGRPIFDPLTFLLFCGGLVICLVKIREPEYAFLLVWMGINIIPSAITRNSPSTLRAIGSLTPIYVLPSLSLDLSWDWAERRFGNSGTRALLAAVVLLLCWNATFTYHDYFVVWAQNEEVRDIYRADLSGVAGFLRESVEDEVVCLSASFAADLDQQVLNFMLGEQMPIRWFDGQQALVFPETKPSQEVLYIIPATGPVHEELASRFFSDLTVGHTAPDPLGEPAFVVYRLSSQELARLRSYSPSHPLSVDVESRVELLGYEVPLVVEAGEELPLLLYWRISQPIRPDLRYSFFAHLTDTRGYVWDQVDALGYPVSNWIEGDLVVQFFDLKVPPDAPPLEYVARLGLYDEVTEERLMAVADGKVMPDGLVVTEPFSVNKSAVPPSSADLDIPRERNANFEDRIELLGCDLETLAAERGGSVRISLFWRAMAEPERDYVISILVTDEGGDETLEEVFRQPVDGLYPTSQWARGEVVRDRFDVVISQSVPDGRHRLWVRLYDPVGERFLLLTGSTDDRVRIGKVLVSARDED